MKTLLVLTSAAIGMIASASAATYTMQDAFKVGLFVKDSAKVGNVEVEGAMIVGKDLTTAGGPFQVRIREGAYLPGKVALAVGGEIKLGNVSVPPVKVSGSVIYKDATFNGVSKTVDANGNYYIDINSIGIGSGSSNSAGGVPVAERIRTTGSAASVDVTQAFNDLQSLSTKINSRAITSAAPYATIVNDTLVLPSATAVSRPELFGDKKFYLFNVDAASINNKATNPTNLTGFDPNTDIIVFNVVNSSGATTLNYAIDMGTGGPVNNGPSNIWADNILWNISDGNLSFTYSKSFIGSLLAPYSKFTAGGSTSEGAFIVREYDGTVAGELHPISVPGGSIISLSVVPEPTSALAGALLALGLFRRQRR